MLIGPRYKKARYLGAAVFRKTQTPKYALRMQAKTKSTKRRSAKSEFGRQLLEKQKARYSYGISGGQFTNYVKSALQTTGDNAKNLLRILEGRLDNAVLRAGFALSRAAARQMVNHGHFSQIEGIKLKRRNQQNSIRSPGQGGPGQDVLRSIADNVVTRVSRSSRRSRARNHR
jgi:small subunit ribosomal protein S4